MVLLFFLVGGTLASFSLWLAQTYVSGGSYVRARSCCPHCGATLGARDLVPVFSYLLLRGRCRHCGHRIAPLYVLTEALCGAIAVVIYWITGLTPITGLFLLLLLFLLTLSLVDWFCTLLPDVMVLPALLIFPVLFVSFGRLSASDALWGLLAGFASSAGLRSLFFWIRKKEGLGFGDVKLFALAGALCGWPYLPLLFFLSASLALLIMGGLFLSGSIPRQELLRYRLPFGPCIAASLLVAMLLREVGIYGAV